MTSAKRILLPALCLLLFLVGPVGALAAKKNFTFSDTRFQGRYTTENLDAIIFFIGLASAIVIWAIKS